jgi:hypothetical protein
MMFPGWFFNLVIVGAIALTGLSAFALMALLVRDWKNGRLW